MKKLARLGIAFASCIVMGLNCVVYAAEFKDVPSDHWAYKAISSVSDKGLILGDMSGNFKPGDFIDKFETTKILAKMAGYKHTDATEQDELYYTRCYENNKALLGQYAAKYTKWNVNYNKEISFLLEKQILVQDDLNQFVVLLDNEEKLRALSREEAGVFLTKVMGKNEEALNTIPADLLNDHNNIAAGYVPYIYYLQKIGIITPDANNNFNPKAGISRASFSVMIDAALALTQTPSAPSTDTAATILETIQGSIGSIYKESNSVQVLSSNATYNGKTFIVSPTAAISMDGYIKTYADLKEGLNFTGVFSGNELISITATTPTEAVAIQTPEIKADDFFEHMILSLTTSEDGSKVIGMEKMDFNPDGTVKLNTVSYKLAANCSIFRENANKAFDAITFEEIKERDFAEFSVKNNEIVSIKIIYTQPTTTNGVLIDKHYSPEKMVAVYTVLDDLGYTHYYRTTSATKLMRKDISSSAKTKKDAKPALWNDLRVGDTVEVTHVGKGISELFAFGIKRFVDVTIKEIYISDSICKIIGVDANNVERVYPIIPGDVDVNKLNVGNKVKLKVDGLEVESVLVLIR